MPEAPTLASKPPGQLPLDALRLERMTSGHLCLNLSERISWEGFDKYAEALLREVGGVKLRIVAESVEMRIWGVTIRGQPLSLVYSDYPSMVSLESSANAGDEALEHVRAMLSALHHLA